MSTQDLELVALHEATRQRYLNYALSVITSRALPDVRDGLKPVQRRILYAMYNNLRLLPDARYRKSAAVVGEVMARYHPHGDTSIYDALVRMAQPFSLRHTLVDGQGNFGSLDGDSAAAMRYTECRLTRLAVELISEIGQRTVDFRPNYDGQHVEPVVLPAQFPQILVNGAEGIAVGMATRIPPHNLREVIDATILVLDDPKVELGALLHKITAPDFPTGGVVLNSAEEIRQLYETGSGTLRLRGEWTTEQKGRKHHVIVTSLPYGVIKAQLVEKIGKLISEKKVPQLLDVRDESTDIVRVVLELRRPEDAEAAMAWLFKHTALQTTFPANLTVLLPGDNPEIAEPARVDLRWLLVSWVDFRLGTVRRRFEYELEQIRKRIHILLAFEKIFNALDEAIALIRKAEGKRDAAERLMHRFDLDDEQADAILELRLYKLAKLEIQAIRDELAELRERESKIVAILASDPALRDVVRTELLELRKLYGEKRRTAVGGAAAAELTYSEDAYIVAEKAAVIVTRDGWIKRQASFTGIDKIRVREGDAIGWLALGRTTSTLSFFTDKGGAYTLRIDELPSTSGYGEPLQRHFQFEDGERVVGVIVHDPGAQPIIRADVRAQYTGEDPPPPHGVALSRLGRVLRFPLEAHKEQSTRGGRRYMRLDEGDAVFACWLSDGTEALCVASELGRGLSFPIVEVSLVRAAGKGVTAIKLNEGDRVAGAVLSAVEGEGVRVKLPSGRDENICPAKFSGSRGDKGEVLFKRGRLSGWEPAIVRYDLLSQPDLFQPRSTEEA